MEIKPLFDPERAGRPMRVAAFLSGSGSNVRRLIEHWKKLQVEEKTSPFDVVLLYSDRSDGSCTGESIALEYALPYASFDIRAFHRSRGLKRDITTPGGIEARKEYDKIPSLLLKAFDVDVTALGGYMSYTTIQGCVNVHPADLSIIDSTGRRKFTGDRAVRDAVMAGETELRSSTLWTDQGVDTGPLLMVSAPVPVKLPGPLPDLVKDKEAFENAIAGLQEELKHAGDWRIFPRTVEMIARGRFALDETGTVYVDRVPVPGGFRENAT
ncbi:MAG TPA: formyl transferase [Desulfobacteraceae bacterium]|nr:formyl transferase [Desulfobacteraceae bacterium]